MPRTRHDEHSPIINSHSSGCTCHRWNGPTIHEGESLGAFTLRAHNAHRAHAADQQTVMFGAGDVGLFAGQEVSA